MSQFHSTMSRRTFMKAIGLAGAGVGSAALTAPVFHDLDEAISSEPAGVKREWWVKERGYLDSTTETDWTIMQRFDSNKHANRNPPTPYISTETWAAEVTPKANDFKKKSMADASPGYRLQDRALSDNNGLPPGATTPWMWPSTATTPTTLGVPKYQGTPEENARLLRSALKAYGASMVGYTPLDEKTKKLILLEWTFEDVPVGYQSGTKMVIPSVPLSIVELGVPNATENMKAAPGFITYGSIGLGHSMIQTTASCTQRFLVEIGYQCYFGGYENCVPHPAFIALDGIGELSRNNGQAINPDFSQTFTPTSLTTDLPLAPTNPIDAGIQRFCGSCMKCADLCPGGSITHDAEPKWEVPGAWSNPGHKQFQNDCVACKRFRTVVGQCMVCMGSCVFTKHNSSMVHQVVKATAATTPMFNGFFKHMDDAFAYGSQAFSTVNNQTTGVFNSKAVDWWNLELPAWGYDPKTPF